MAKRRLFITGKRCRNTQTPPDKVGVTFHPWRKKLHAKSRYLRDKGANRNGAFIPLLPYLDFSRRHFCLA